MQEPGNRRRLLAAHRTMSAHPLPVALLALFCLLPVAALPGQAATLTVHVRDGQTRAPLAGAFVMVGLFEGDPFDGNVGWTDGAGNVVFDDPSLDRPQTVTAGAANLGYTTLYGAALAELTLPLFPAVMDTMMGGTRTEVQGTVTHIAVTNNDGNLDIALIMPAVNASDYLFQDMYPYWTAPDVVSFPVIGPVVMPGNTFMPDQVEYLFFHFSKSPWHMGVPGGRPVTFFSASARIAISDLIGGTAMQNMVVREVGVERDVYVGGPMQLTIDSDLDLTRSLTARFDDVPSGDSLLVVSGALFTSGGQELALGYDTRGGLVEDGTSFLLSSREPGGDISDAVNVAVGAHSDTSRALTYSAGIVDRSGFVPPYTVVFDSWMRLPEVTQNGHYFSWEDPTEPGVSPSPTWTRSNLGLRPIDPADSTMAVSAYWRVYAPAGPRHFVLPVLPAGAPGPPGGLPDPSQTPEADQLCWTFVAADPVGTGAQIVQDFIHEATHWTQRWVPIEMGTTGAVTDPLLAEGVIDLRAVPNPAASETRLTWSSAAPGAATLELRGPDGRLVQRFPAALSGADLRWDGHDAQGRPVPAGVYWVTLRRAGELLGSRRVVWLRSAP